LQNKEKMLISKTKNGSFKEVMQCFSSLRAEGEAILLLFHRLLRFATANLVMTLVFSVQHYLLYTMLLEIGK